MTRAWCKGSSACCTSRWGWAGASVMTMRNRPALLGSPPATRGRASRISSAARVPPEQTQWPLTVKPAGDGSESREIGYRDLFGDGVEHGAAQLPAIAAIARLARGAGIDHEHLADAPGQLMVCVAV